MRILVYGAGVQGCQLAHSLAQNKKNVVTLLARGEWKAVIDQKGPDHPPHAPAENNGGSDADDRCTGPRGCV